MYTETIILMSSLKQSTKMTEEDLSILTTTLIELSNAKNGFDGDSHNKPINYKIKRGGEEIRTHNGLEQNNARFFLKEN